MTTFEFAHIHASGFHKADLADVRLDWDNYRTNPATKLITGTEARNFDAAFKAAGWDGKRAGECVCTWRSDTFELAWEPSLRPLARRFTFRRGTNPNATANLASFPLRHIASNRVVMVRVCHMPSKVQDGERFRFKEARNVAAWANALRRWGHINRRFKRDHVLAAGIDVADWNVDLKRRHWRALIATALGKRCAWSKRLPRRGSHGSRLIDGAFYRLLKVTSANTLPKGKSSDHRPIRTTFRIKSKGA